MTCEEYHYEVYGGCVLNTFETDSYDDALRNFLDRIRITRPFSDCDIVFRSNHYVDNELVGSKIEHRVRLV